MEQVDNFVLIVRFYRRLLPARGGAGMEGGAMEWLNYHHLLYFWVVACHGSVTRAAAELRLAQPTVSTQLRTLEAVLGEKLFARTGRRLVLTDVGRLVFRYARSEEHTSELQSLRH